MNTKAMADNDVEFEVKGDPPHELPPPYSVDLSAVAPPPGNAPGVLCTSVPLVQLVQRDLIAPGVPVVAVPAAAPVIQIVSAAPTADIIEAPRCVPALVPAISPDEQYQTAMRQLQQASEAVARLARENAEAAARHAAATAAAAAEQERIQEQERALAVQAERRHAHERRVEDAKCDRECTKHIVCTPLLACILVVLTAGARACILCASWYYGTPACEHDCFYEKSLPKESRYWIITMYNVCLVALVLTSLPCNPMFRANYNHNFGRIAWWCLKGWQVAIVLYLVNQGFASYDVDDDTEHVCGDWYWRMGPHVRVLFHICLWWDLVFLEWMTCNPDDQMVDTSSEFDGLKEKLRKHWANREVFALISNYVPIHIRQSQQLIDEYVRLVDARAHELLAEGAGHHLNGAEGFAVMGEINAAILRYRIPV